MVDKKVPYQMQKFETVLCAVLLASLAACAHKPIDLPSGQEAYERFPVNPPAAQRLYRIGSFDTISATVFQEPDLSIKSVQVDAGGTIVMPLIGPVQASGRSTEELAAEITQRLDRYIVSPQVVVVVDSSATQHVTVSGAVTEPGVYEIRGRSTLLDALARAKGTDRVARLEDVVIFRTINGQRMGALFNVAQIERGESPDPEVLGSDTIIVGLSNVKAAWRDILVAAPLIAIFRPFN